MNFLAAFWQTAVMRMYRINMRNNKLKYKNMKFNFYILLPWLFSIAIWVLLLCLLGWCKTMILIAIIGVIITIVIHNQYKNQKYD